MLRKYLFPAFLFLLLIQSVQILEAQDKASPPQSENAEKPRVSPLSFEDAFQKMISSNEGLIAAKLEEDQRRFEKSAAFGLYFPKIDAKMNVVKMSNPVTMDLNDIRTAILSVQAATFKGVNPAGLTPYEQAAMQQTAAGLPDFKKTIAEDHFVKLDATIQGPIFTGGKIVAANNAASARIDEAGYKQTDTRNRLTTELVTRYFGLCLSIKVIEVRKMVLDGMTKHLNDAKSLERNGQIAHVERLHAEVAYSDADREFKKSTRDRSLALTALNNTLSASDEIEPSTPLFVLTDIQQLDYFQQRALESNPLLKQIAANKDLAHQSYLKECAGFSPDIFYFGSKQIYGYNTPSRDIVPNWVVGIGATATIFEGFSGYEKVKAAQAQEDRVASLEGKAKKDILTLVDKNYQELLTALEQYRSIDASYKFAEEYLRVREKAFAEGSATSLDVVDAQLAFAKVKIDRLKSIYDYDIALASLLEASGQSGSIMQFMNSKETEVGF